MNIKAVKLSILSACPHASNPVLNHLVAKGEAHSVATVTFPVAALPPKPCRRRRLRGERATLTFELRRKRSWLSRKADVCTKCEDKEQVCQDKNPHPALHKLKPVVPIMFFDSASVTALPSGSPFGPHLETQLTTCPNFPALCTPFISFKLPATTMRMSPCNLQLWMMAMKSFKT